MFKVELGTNHFELVRIRLLLRNGERRKLEKGTFLGRERRGYGKRGEFGGGGATRGRKRNAKPAAGNRSRRERLPTQVRLEHLG